MLNLSIIGIIVVIIIATITIAIFLRTVVPTNMVHVVQSSKKTTSYGGTSEANGGNVYYAWPSWIPRLGITVIKLPISNFDLSLKSYDAYDKERVPFMVDVTAFFRIDDTEKAARRVSNLDELKSQLLEIIEGAIRRVLASSEIDHIMVQRSEFGKLFTDEVAGQLEEWGVENVKLMELKDIRDSQGSTVIQNIMAKRISFIDKDSRQEVAKNKKEAETAEIQAQQEIDVQRQESEQVVGEKTAAKEQAVGVAEQQSRQEILTEEKETKTREMDVKQVEEVKQAEIEKSKQVVTAEQDKETMVIRADGELEAEKKKSEGIKVVGIANAEAEKAMQLAPVEAQITLAKEIGENSGYQEYLKTIEAIKGYVIVGGEQAKALQEADVKVISNTGKPSHGMSSVMDLFTSEGGTNLAASIEAFSQGPMGAALFEKIGIGTPSGDTKNVEDESVEDKTPETENAETNGEQQAEK